ncbi:MAG: type II toxin-antitoxin system HicB family antitoxin [Alphaproteobacteria bacterium]|nr:type II toxin-antitoxin system HicB family antitoxin [Alphaproteobacteria bacterium]
MIDYAFTVRKLSDQEGGGYLAEAIELNGCIADGSTPEEAVHNLEDSINSWIRTMTELGRPVPQPCKDSFSGKWVVRTPKTLHKKLTELSKIEGVSLNTLIVSLLSEGIGVKMLRAH